MFHDWLRQLKSVVNSSKKSGVLCVNAVDGVFEDLKVRNDVVRAGNPTVLSSH